MTRSRDLVVHLAANLGPWLDLLRRLVEIESCSLDKAGVDRLAEFLAREFGRNGAEAEILPVNAGGNALKAVWRGNGSGRRVLFLGHLDTVWPAGTVAVRPFRLEERKAYGPGVYDMKCGLLLCLMICLALRDGWVRAEGEVVFFFVPDEETGSAIGLPLLESIARGCAAVLCLEPPLPGGRAKTFRKGVGTFHVWVDGIAAHAGVDHSKGANAIVELSRQVVKLQGMTAIERGTTVSVGTIHGGTAVNVVPAEAHAEVDFRFETLDEGRRLEKCIGGLQPYDERCRLRILGGINRPPLERTAAVMELYEMARTVAASIGMELGEGSTGGGSDGSFTAAWGIPTLDGLGVDGDGAHAESEHILVEDIPRRAALLSLLAQEVLR